MPASIEQCGSASGSGDPGSALGTAVTACKVVVRVAEASNASFTAAKCTVDPLPRRWMSVSCHLGCQS